MSLGRRLGRRESAQAGSHNECHHAHHRDSITMQGVHVFLPWLCRCNGGIMATCGEWHEVRPSRRDSPMTCEALDGGVASAAMAEAAVCAPAVHRDRDDHLFYNVTPRVQAVTIHCSTPLSIRNSMPSGVPTTSPSLGVVHFLRAEGPQRRRTWSSRRARVGMAFCSLDLQDAPRRVRPKSPLSIVRSSQGYSRDGDV